MSSFLSLLPSDGWARLMIDALWQGTLIVSVEWLVARLLAPQAVARAWLLLVALTACLLAPLATMAARSAGWTILSRPATRLIAKPFHTDNNSEPGPASNADRLESARVGSPTIGEKTSFDNSIADQPAIAPSNVGMKWLSLMAIVWMSVSALLFSRLMLSLGVIRRILRHATPCNDAQLVEAALEAARRVGLNHQPRLLISDSVSTPMVLALTRSVVLLPRTGSSTFGDIDWTALFAHELAHVTRHDGWSRLWVQLVTMVVPLQPLVWPARRAFYMACEEACDDWAVAVGSDPVQLANTLTAWANHPMRSGPLLAIGMSSTKGRILRLLALRTKPIAELGTSWRWTGICAAIVLTASLAVAQMPANGRPQVNVTDEPSNIVSEQTRAQQQVETKSEESAEHTNDKIVISGTCSDENKKPLAGAHIRLFLLDYNRDDKSQRQFQDVRTNEMGQFRFTDVDIQQVHDTHAALLAVAQLPGRATIVRRIEKHMAREYRIDITLSAAGAMQGRITTVDGTPIAGAIVSANCGLPMDPIPGICAAVTDAEGRYEISDLNRFDLANQEPQPAGNGVFDTLIALSAQVRHPDYSRQPFNYTKIPSTVDVTLHRSAIVEGQVVLSDSEMPASGAQVEFWNDAVRPDYWTRSKVDDLGRYRLANLPPGTYRVSAILKGRPNLFRADVVLRSGQNTLDLRMGKGGHINGHVIDVSTGKPIVLGETETMSIGASDDHGHSYRGMNNATIRSDGTFTLLLPAGRNYLGMYLGSNWRGVNTDALLQKGINVAEGQTQNLEILVKPRARDGDQPPMPR
ncbi:MAG: M56 family metallopeptidase [Pirellulaceae bacterium]